MGLTKNMRGVLVGKQRPTRPDVVTQMIHNQPRGQDPGMQATRFLSSSPFRCSAHPPAHGFSQTGPTHQETVLVLDKMRAKKKQKPENYRGPKPPRGMPASIDSSSAPPPPPKRSSVKTRSFCSDNPMLLQACVVLASLLGLSSGFVVPGSVYRSGQHQYKVCSTHVLIPPHPRHMYRRSPRAPRRRIGTQTSANRRSWCNS